MTKARDLANASTALSAVSATELAFVDGVTSAIQTQMDAKTAKATLTTTGDIYYASAANTPARLGIGSASNVLTVSGGVPAWSAPAGGGKVLQVVNVVYSTSAANNTSTYADTGLSASITPTLNTSKVLVIINQNGLNKTTGNLESGVGLRLLRGATDLLTFAISEVYTGTSGLNNWGSCATTYLDSPATTSSTTYKTQLKNTYYNGNGVSAQTNGASSTITLIEIGA